jgi:aspartate kinase
VTLIVQKFGGTSVADPERMKNVARHVAETRKQGNQVVVVVSAMGKATDNLVELARQVSTNPQGREMDMLLTTGERISMSLLCMALNDLGCEAMSFTGSRWESSLIHRTPRQRSSRSKAIEFAVHSRKEKWRW